MPRVSPGFVGAVLALACASAGFANTTPVVLTVNPALPAGSGNFTTIQSAIDSIAAGNIQPYRIDISPGTYDEAVLVPAGKEYITLNGVGATRDDVVMSRHDWMGGPNGWEGSQPLRAYANNFRCQNLTLINTWGDNGQATALRTKGDKQIFDNVVLDGWQDTFLAEGGRQYFHNSEIRGRVDFIYGPANVVFEGDNIVSRNGGHVTAASTPAANPYGFTFINSTLNYDHNAPYAQADLGRPWGPTAAVAYINTWMDSHILPAGWNDWGNAANQLTARYVEYNTTGPGANPGARVSWSRQLTAAEAAAYTTPNIFGGWDPLNTPMVPVSWTGTAGDAKWSSAANWDTTLAPMPGQNLYIQPATSMTVTVDSAAVGDQLALGKTGAPANLYIAPTGNMNISGGLFLNGGSVVTVDGGSLTVPSIQTDAANTNNQVILKNNGTLNLGNWTGPWGPSGLLVINKGTFAAKGIDGAQINLAPNVGDVATLNIRDGDNWAKTRYIATGDGISIINQTGGTVNGTYGPYMGNSGTGVGTATYNISGGTAYWLDPDLGKSTGGTFTVNQTAGTIYPVGGTGTQYSFNDGVIKVGDRNGSNATWNLSGSGTLNHRAMAVGVSGTGNFYQTGGAVTLYQPFTSSTKGFGLHIGTGSSTGRGLYEISGGSLTIQNGGLTLGYDILGVTPATATGTFKVDGGLATVKITGDFKENANSTLAARLEATGLSTIAVNGNVTFLPGALLDLSYLTGATPGTYTLMTWTGTATGTPILASGTEMTNWSYVLDPVARTLTVTAAAVPEPATLGVLGLATMGLFLHRRR